MINASSNNDNIIHFKIIVLISLSIINKLYNTLILLKMAPKCMFKLIK